MKYYALLPTFDELASAAADQDEEVLLDALDEAVGAQLIAPGSDDSFSFTHDKIREVLYEELNPIRRRRLHRHVAEGLEKNPRGYCCTVEKLAHHYIQAGDHERGLHYAKQAALEAQRVFAFDEAIAAYSRARDCAEALGLVDEQMAQEEAIGKAYLLHGEMIPAGEHFEKALGLATEPAVRARLQCEAASSLVATGDQRGVEFLSEALKVLDPVANPLETANAVATEARFHHLAGRHKKAIELLKEAAELVRPTAEGDTVDTFAAPLIAQIYAWSAGAHQHYGRGTANLLYSRFETLRCFAEVRFRRAVAGVSTGEVGVDELSEAERLCKEADELIGPTESRVSQLWLGPLYLEVLLKQKRRAEAESNFELSKQKLSEAKERLEAYQRLVAQCQSPRFTAEAGRITELLATE